MTCVAMTCVDVTCGGGEGHEQREGRAYRVESVFEFACACERHSSPRVEALRIDTQIVGVETDSFAVK